MFQDIFWESPSYVDMYNRSTYEASVIGVITLEFRNGYIYRKARMMGLSNSEKNLFSCFDPIPTNGADRQTDR